LFISSENILQLINGPSPIISPCDRTFIEGGFYDLRLEQVYVPKEDSWSAWIGTASRNTPEVKILTQVAPEHLSTRLKAQNGAWRLWPGFYLLQTVETITPPRWLIGLLDERTSVFRSGGITRATKIPHGFSGKIAAALHVPERCFFTLEEGMRFLSVCFALMVTLKLDKNLEPVLPFQLSFDGGHKYDGIWGEDKVSTEGIERAF
jgi:deoxycytidine triphosphate deaminase